MLEYLETKTEIELKSLTKDDDGAEFYPFEGYASTFNMIDHGSDRIKNGAFLETVSQKGPRIENGNLRSDIKILYQHSWFHPIGLPEHMEEDSRGLFTKGRIYLTALGKDVVIAIKAKIVDKMSIGYRAKEYDYEEVEFEEAERKFTRLIRNLNKIELMEYSPVTFPMNQWADITKDLGIGKKIHYVGLSLSKDRLEDISKECGLPIERLKNLYIGTTEESSEKEKKVDVSEKPKTPSVDEKLVSVVKSLDTETKSLLLKLLGDSKKEVEPEEKSESTKTKTEESESKQSCENDETNTKTVEAEETTFSLDLSNWVKSQLEEERK